MMTSALRFSRKFKYVASVYRQQEPWTLTQKPGSRTSGMTLAGGRYVVRLTDRMIPVLKHVCSCCLALVFQNNCDKVSIMIDWKWT